MTHTASTSTIDTLHEGISSLRESVPNAIGRTAAQVQSAAQRGLDRARETGQHMRERAQYAGDQTVGYIRDEPVKSILIAAAAGAALAAVLGWLTTRSRRA